MYVLVLILVVGSLPPSVVVHDFATEESCQRIGKAVALLAFDKFGDDAKTEWSCIEDKRTGIGLSLGARRRLGLG